MKQVKYFLFLFSTLYVYTGAFAQKNSVAFIENRNQWVSEVKYKADIPGGAVFLTDAGFTYSFLSTGDLHEAHEKEHTSTRTTAAVLDDMVHGHAYRINLLGCNVNTITYSTQEKRKEYYNFFLGNDPSRWAGKVPAYDVVVKHNVYDGIDMKIYSDMGSMKYDFIVAPGARPERIILNFEGVEPLMTKEGALRLLTSVNEVTEGAPESYQWIAGKKKSIPSRYRKLENGDIIFEFPEGYDTRYPLTIDPALIFGTYSGGTPETLGYCAAYDLNGAAFSAGNAGSAGWPVTIGAFQQSLVGARDAVINKYTPDGSSLIFATYYGGSFGESPFDLNITSNNELIMMGLTGSNDLPVTAGCYDNTNNGAGDYYIVRFSEDGSALLGATYVGGTGPEAPDFGDAQLSTDHNGDIVVVGNSESNDFPVTATAAQPVFGGIQDGVVFKLSADCSQLLYATYLGGSIRDMCMGLAINAQNDIVVCGNTNSNDFPITQGVMMPAPGEGFVSVINTVTGTLSVSTYVSGSALNVQVDEIQNIIVMGNSGNYPVSAGVFNVPDGDVFLDRLQPDLSASIQSTRIGVNTVPLGGGTVFSPTAFFYDACGNTYIAGQGVVPGMPVTPDAYDATATTGLYFCVLSKNWQNLLYGSYLSGEDHVTCHSNARFDPKGNLYYSVCTNDQNFAITPGAYATNFQAAGFDNAFIKFDMGFVSDPLAVNLTDTFICDHDPITVTAAVTNADAQTIYQWSPAAAILSNPNSPSVIIDPAVSRDIILTASNRCGAVTDTLHIEVSEVANASVSPTDTAICPGDTVQLVATGGTTYEWRENSTLMASGNTARVWPDTPTTYVLFVSDTNNCEKELTVTVTMQPFPEVDAGIDIDLALGKSTHLNGRTSANFIWQYNVANPYILNPEVSPRVTTTYYLTANSGAGCTAVDSVTVYVANTGIPNVFSPNGDGLNDVFRPVFNLEDSRYIPVDFSVYNRWGQRVYYTMNVRGGGWDGTYKNRPAELGTYVYYFKYRIGEHEFTKKGDLTLIR